MASAVSPLYLLERSDVGVVHLDNARHVTGMNDFARRVLPVDRMQPFNRMVLSFHPERSQPKVEFLLDQAAACPVANPPPMTMIINIPERVLLIKVSRTADGAQAPTGYVLVFYDITELVAAQEQPVADAGAVVRRQLQKIPTSAGQRIVFVDADDVLRLHSDGHYTRVVTADANQFCNLSIGDMETRLAAEHFMRVHRSHIVNLRQVAQLLRVDGRLVLKLRGDSAEVPVSRTSSSAPLNGRQQRRRRAPPDAGFGMRSDDTPSAALPGRSVGANGWMPDTRARLQTGVGVAPFSRTLF